MVNTLIKSSLREIRGSLGRFIAIMAIIGLGVGFFAGLRMCQPRMEQTGIEYVEKQELFDFRLISTLGFTDEDVEYFCNQDGVNAAEGAYTADFLMIEDNTKTVIRAHSLTERINLPHLTAGDYPQKENECLADARHFTAKDIGNEIKVSPENDEDTLNTLTCDRYIITGLCQSPYYLNYDRGTTTAGNGSVSAFIYIPKGGFSSEAYHEVFLTIENMPDAFTGEYNDKIDILKDTVTDWTEQRADLRYETILKDANEEISDAESEIKDSRSAYLREKNSTEKQLNAAFSKLKNGESTLQQSEADYRQGLSEYEAGLQQYNNALAELNSGQSALNEKRKELEGLKQQIDSMNTALAAEKDALEKMDPASAEYAEAAEAYAAHKAAYEQYSAQYQAGKTELDNQQINLDNGFAELKKNKTILDNTLQQLEGVPAQLESAKEELEKGRAEYNNGKATAERELSKAEAKLNDAETTLNEEKNKLDDIKKPDCYILTRQENSGCFSFVNDTSIVAAISLIFPVFFFLVAALVCVTTMTRMIDEQRTQIGILKALGFSRHQVIRKYLIYSGSAAVIGSTAGYFAGVHLLPSIIWKVYGIMYGFAPLSYRPDIPLFFISMAAALLCSAGSTWIACRAELKLAAAELVRPKTPKAGKRILLEYLTPVWNRLGFMKKISLRNVFRYRSRLILMILGIGGCTALLITGFGIKDSISNVIDLQFSEVTLYDYSVSFSEEQSKKDAREFLKSYGFEENDGLLISSVSADIGGKSVTKSATVLVSSSGSFDGFLSLHADKSKLKSPEMDEVLISNGLAENLGLSKGDTFTISTDQSKPGEFTVTGIFDNYVSNYVLLTEENYSAKLGGVPAYKTLFIKDKGSTDPYQMGAKLGKDEKAASVSINEVTRNQVDKLLSSLNYIVLIVIVCAAALAFIVLYNLTNINITERIREIATIKVLGFYSKEISSYVFRENMILTLLGGFAGLFMGKGLHAFVMAQVKIDQMCFPCTVLPFSYIISFLLTVLFTCLVSLVMNRKLRKIDMAESLKSTE